MFYTVYGGERIQGEPDHPWDEEGDKIEGLEVVWVCFPQIPPMRVLKTVLEEHKYLKELVVTDPEKMLALESYAKNKCCGKWT